MKRVLRCMKLSERCATAMMEVTHELSAGWTLFGRFARRLLVSIRLIAPDGQVPPAARCEAIARALHLPDWTAVLDSLYRARQAVAAQWQADFAQQLEVER